MHSSLVSEGTGASQDALPVSMAGSRCMLLSNLRSIPANKECAEKAATTILNLSSHLSKSLPTGDVATRGQCYTALELMIGEEGHAHFGTAWLSPSRTCLTIPELLRDMAQHENHVLSCLGLCHFAGKLLQGCCDRHAKSKCPRASKLDMTSSSWCARIAC